MSNSQDISCGTMKWDPQNLEIRTRSVEKTLEPLMSQVATLVDIKTPSKVQRGKSVEGPVLAAMFKKAVESFISNGESIANENPDINYEMMAAVGEVKNAGEIMTSAAKEFIRDPLSSEKRVAVIRASKGLLSSVTHLLIFADMVDVHRLLMSLHTVKHDLKKILSSTSELDLVQNLELFYSDATILIMQASNRQRELKDKILQDNLAAARVMIQNNEMLLFTSTKVFLKHFDVLFSKENRDYVIKQIHIALKLINDVAQGKSTDSFSNILSYNRRGKLASFFYQLDNTDFVQSVMACFDTHAQFQYGFHVEEKLKDVICNSSSIAESTCTRAENRSFIITDCNKLQTLKTILAEYSSNVCEKQETEDIKKIVCDMEHQFLNLRRHLQMAVLDHVSDLFLEISVPVLALIEIAKCGNVNELEEYIKLFEEHATKIIDVADLACAVSSNGNAIELAQYACIQVKNLYPQVVSAAKLLALRPSCLIAYDNMYCFCNIWEYHVALMIEAVDDVINVDDFLEVSENHIIEDVNKCMKAFHEGDVDVFDRTAGTIRNRIVRICNIVTAEMGSSSQNDALHVLDVISVLKHQVMYNFAEQVELAIQKLTCIPVKNLDNCAFVDVCRSIYRCVQEIRRILSLNLNDDESHLNIETDIKSEEKSILRNCENFGMSGKCKFQDADSFVSREEKQKISDQVKKFHVEKNKFDKEIVKWSDAGNNIITTSKKMCTIMVEITDFFWGKGPLKTATDVINATENLTELGSDLDKLAREMAELCPESTIRKDLLSNLQRIALHCHQLNISSKVRADMQNLSGNLVVFELDNTTSLIQAMKNLMQSIILTVQASHAASTKILTHQKMDPSWKKNILS